MPNGKAPVIGLVMWTGDGQEISRHVAWEADEKSLSASRDEFIDLYLKPAMIALENATGKKLFPDVSPD